MAKLAIKGHATRGNEVISLLEMLGGKNIHNYGGTFNECYTIDNNKICTIYTSVAKISDYVIITLEDFLEKYPYKVGNKVVTNDCDVCKIHSMYWDRGLNRISYILETPIGLSKGWSANELQPVEEKQTMGEKKINQMSLANCDLNEVEIVLGDKFELKIKDGKYYAVRKQYPKTYEECCDVLIPDCVEFNVILNGYNSVLLEEFGKLLICRDAYWKLADNWKPDWNNISDKHCIYVVGKEMWLKECQTRQCTLAFPTAEMRNAFYENFKDLIKQCKELL